MPFFTLRVAGATMLAMCLLHAQAASAQVRELKLDRSLAPLPGDEAVPTFIIADRLEGLSETEVEARGHAELHKGEKTLRADRVRYYQDRDEVLATGNARLLMRGDEISGPRLRMRLKDTQGIFDEPEFRFAPRALLKRDEPSAKATAVESAPPPEVSGRGEAKALRFLGNDQYRLSQARFTTCAPEQDDWFVNADELHVDMERQVATARDFSLSFLGVSTPDFPWFAFPLNNARKSGFLPPTLAISGKSGSELAVPYYWNIAPNYDATITPRYMSKRGLQMQTEFRYLQPNYQGEINYEYMPNDAQLGDYRAGATIQHRANWHNGWSGVIDYSEVSDRDYFRDLSSTLSVATQSYLRQDGYLRYSSTGGDWSAQARVQKFQVLQDPLNPIPEPYERVPQITFNFLNRDLRYLDLGLQSEFVAFEHPTEATGRRMVAYPSVAVPIMGPAGYFTPKIGLHSTWYNLDSDAPGRRSISRSIPIASLDTGMYFERETNWLGRDWIQTLEPRLYYLRVPRRRQDDIPLFDTSLSDFNATQLFSENIYSGSDRIADANHLTLALSTRFISPENGQEILRGFIGQRYYFDDQEVALTGDIVPRTSDASPILASVSGRFAPNWSMETTVQYGWSERELERLNAGIRYSPAPASVANLSYRYTSKDQTTIGAISAIDVSAQWPLAPRWYGLMRFNYDTNGGDFVEQLAGIEYNVDCWILRAVVHQFKTATNQETKVFFLQLELNGFSRIGSNPFDTLRRNIPGYTQTNLIGAGEMNAFDRGGSVSPWRSDDDGVYGSR